jgi:hypothetical protein
MVSSHIPLEIGPAAATVVLFGSGAPSAASLLDALSALPGRAELCWSVRPAVAVSTDLDVAIVVCDAELTRAALGRWPAASVIALVAAYDDGSGVVRALDDGADVCVRGPEIGVVAAYVRATARRRALPEAAGR